MKFIKNHSWMTPLLLYIVTITTTTTTTTMIHTSFAFTPLLQTSRLPHSAAPKLTSTTRRYKREISSSSFSSVLQQRRKSVSLTTQEADDEGMKIKKRDKYFFHPIQKALSKFKARPLTYLIIPVIAAIVGWVTNYLAVQMIFYPIEYRGLNFWRRTEVPLGLIGWQGIVPCKTRPMSVTMVNMVTTQLLSLKEVFGRLDPNKVADLLAPEVASLGQSIVEDYVPVKWMADIPRSIFVELPTQTKSVLVQMNKNFLKDFTIAMQQNIESLFNVEDCVVNQMMMDRSKLGLLFRKCAQAELDFLTNSGLWFGFLLGIIQMIVALFWDNPWSLSVGGLIVGYATNWLALKWIFEPVNPTKVGPFVLQGQFLRRQKEVAAEFSKFFAENVLTSEKMWDSILTDPSTTPAFHKLFKEHFLKFASAVACGLSSFPNPEVLSLAAARAVEKLPNHVGVLHSYVDETLGLRETLRIKMEQMSSEKFERVLHPIFEEDELTLILAGAALGLIAGLIQQGLATGQIKLPSWGEVKKQFRNMKDSIPTSWGEVKTLLGGWKDGITKINLKQVIPKSIQKIKRRVTVLMQSMKTLNLRKKSSLSHDDGEEDGETNTDLSPTKEP